MLGIVLNAYNGYMSTTSTSLHLVDFADNTTYNYRIWQAKSDDSYSVAGSYSSTLTPTTYPVKVYIGGSWVEKPVKYYNGSSWVTTKARAKT